MCLCNMFSWLSVWPSWFILHMKRISTVSSLLLQRMATFKKLYIAALSPQRQPLYCTQMLPRKWESFGVMASQNSPYISMSVKEDEWQATRMFSQLNRNHHLFNRIATHTQIETEIITTHIHRTSKCTRTPTHAHLTLNYHGCWSHQLLSTL